MTSSRFDNIPLDESKGQVWTPDQVGKQMVHLLLSYLDHPVSILDPASGPGTFLELVNESQIDVSSFTAIEIDPLLHEVASQSAQKCRFSSSLINADFLSEDLELPQFDAVIVNPPYIRHEKIGSELKRRLAVQFSTLTSQNISFQTNLYGYFLLKSLQLLKPGGLLCAIVYDSLCTTRYGKVLEAALWQLGEFVCRQKVESPFSNRLIDSEIIIIKKRVDLSSRDIDMREIEPAMPIGYCKLQELARVTRGTSFVKRSYFVFKQPSSDVFLTPFISKHRPGDDLSAKPNSYAILQTGNDKFDTTLLKFLNNQYWRDGHDKSLKIPTAMSGGLLFNYYLRTNVRHLINESRIPASDNFYCIETLRPADLPVHWVIANSEQYLELLMSASRPQGSGLRKLQLYEYRSVPFPNYKLFSLTDYSCIERMARIAISQNWSIERVRGKSSELLRSILARNV